MHAVGVALSKGWTSLWLELNSTYAVQLFLSCKTQVSWHLEGEWARCSHLISLMDFCITHIFEKAMVLLIGLPGRGLHCMAVLCGIIFLVFVVHFLVLA